MTLFKHELRQGKIPLLVWSAAISLMLAVCVLLYPLMNVILDETFAQMGAELGMEEMFSLSEFTDYFGVECGEMLGLGGAIFAAILGSTALSKEEKNRTAEFLLTHPISRTSVVTAKLAAVMAQLLILNIAVVAVNALAMLAVGVTVEVGTLALLYLAYFLLQVEVAAITFGLSACLRRGGVGIGLGLVGLFYFLYIIGSLVEETAFLNYLTPFGYAEGATIAAENAIAVWPLVVGMALTALGIVLAYIRYPKKDIA